MIQVRSSVFETNSSSIHSICIARGSSLRSKDYSYPAHLDVHLRSYGWEFAKLETVEDRASYVYSLAMSMDEAEGEVIKSHIFDICSENDVDVDFDLDRDDFWGVDHACDGTEFLLDMLHNKKLLRDFIFCKRSCVFTGNDNSEAPKHLALDEDAWLDKNPGGIAYFKGN